MGRHGADGDAGAFRLHALELGDAAEIDQVARLRQPLLEGRDEGHPTCHDLSVALAGDETGGIRCGGRPVISEIMHDPSSPYSAAILALLIACQTLSGVAGIEMS
jgi:hypothetical protein